MAGATSLERLLRRDRCITAAALLVLCAAAWAYVIAGAGMGMAPALPDVGGGVDMAPMAPAPSGMAGMGGMHGAPPQPGAEDAVAGLAARGLLVVLMWWSMMVAMMAPSAAPMVLLYARVARTSRASLAEPALGRTGWFVAGYLAVWLAFSLAAALLQLGLEQLAWLSPVEMSAGNRRFAALVLLLAGLYQLSPVQDFCLKRCRWPADFLAEHYRPGDAGAFRLGLLHGAHCVGCCWLLMAVLFVVGVMNLAWIAALTLVVAAQKMLPGGLWIGRAVGAALIAWGILTLA